MKKAIVFTALAFSAATLSAQYNIDLSRVTPPSIEYLKMEGGVTLLKSILYCAESVAALKANAVNTIAFFMIDM